MYAPKHDFFRALINARKATRAGNAADADRWTRLAERHLAISRRLERLAEASPTRSPSSPSAPKGPVMLDPDGFSPSGISNAHLNLQRLERAGMDASRATALWREQQQQKR